MSYEIAVYHRSGIPPSLEAVSKLLHFAGWKIVLAESENSLSPAASIGSSTAIGWEIDGTETLRIQAAMTNRDAAELRDLSDQLCRVSVTSENPFEFEQEVIDEMRSAKIPRQVITKAQEATARYEFSSPSDDDRSVDFQWALASAVGVLVDGILEDFEEGTLVDCLEEDG